MTTRSARPLLAATLVLASLLAGCSSPPSDTSFRFNGTPPTPDTTGLATAAWPHINGTLTILDNGAAPNIAKAAAQFTKLTGVKVTIEDGHDAGKALNTLAATSANGQYDVIYGLDNVLIHRARKLDLVEPYKPVLGVRVEPRFVESEFVTSSGSWYATPVDHGYVALNVDHHHPVVAGQAVTTLAKVRTYADQLVVEDPANSSPGLGFLLATIAKYGDRNEAGYAGHYDWHDYWKDLFSGKDTDRDRDGKVAGCVLVAEDWSEAYVQHFSGGYGASSGLADKPIVVSYTESPAIEHYFGTEADQLAGVVLEVNATWHQIQTMAIAKGTKNLGAAQAWIEFSLTDAFQKLAAPEAAVYPVVAAISTADVYGGVDPAPGSFVEARISADRIADRLDTWLSDWKALKQAPGNCRT